MRLAELGLKGGNLVFKDAHVGRQPLRLRIGVGQLLKLFRHVFVEHLRMTQQ